MAKKKSSKKASKKTAKKSSKKSSKKSAAKSAKKSSKKSSKKSAAKEPKSKGGLNKTEKDKYRKMLLEKREILVEDIQRMERDSLGRSRQDQSGDLSNMPIHMADISADNFELELTLGLIENEERQIREIDLALERLEDGSYGSCEACDGKITKARLRAIPNAKLCIACKKLEEEGML